MPLLHLLAGPNGAGKSSYVRDVLAPATGLPFGNRIAGGGSFITESVLSRPSKVQLVADAIEAGYLVHLHVVIIPVELAVQRVLERERRGGHSVPEHKIRERHDRLWGHVDAAIQLADLTDVFDNSSARTPFRRCATFAQGTLIGTPEWPRWTPAVLRQGPSSRHQTDD